MQVILFRGDRGEGMMDELDVERKDWREFAWEAVFGSKSDEEIERDFFEIFCKYGGSIEEKTEDTWHYNDS